MYCERDRFADSSEEVQYAVDGSTWEAECTRGFSQGPEDSLGKFSMSVYLRQDKEVVFRFLMTTPSSSAQVSGFEFHRSWCINTRRKRDSSAVT